MPPANPCNLSYPLFSFLAGGVLFIVILSPRFPPIVLPRHARCVLSHLYCNGLSLLLSSYLSRIGRIENPSCSACGHSSQDISDLILHCPATESLRRLLFADFLSLHNLWSRLCGVVWLLGLHLPPSIHPSQGVGYQQQLQQNSNYQTYYCITKRVSKFRPS